MKVVSFIGKNDVYTKQFCRNTTWSPKIDQINSGKNK